MVWDQKLGLIQDRQLLLTLVALDDHLEWSGRGTRKPGAGPGRAGRGWGARDSPGSYWGAGRGSAALPYSGRLRTELCVRPSGAEASCDSASLIPEGRLRARPAPAPALGAVGPTALHRGDAVGRRATLPGLAASPPGIWPAGA